MAVSWFKQGALGLVLRARLRRWFAPAASHGRCAAGHASDRELAPAARCDLRPARASRSAPAAKRGPMRSRANSFEPAFDDRCRCRPRRRSGPARRGTGRSPVPSTVARSMASVESVTPSSSSRAASLTIGSTSRHWISSSRVGGAAASARFGAGRSPASVVQFGVQRRRFALPLSRRRRRSPARSSSRASRARSPRPIAGGQSAATRRAEPASDFEHVGARRPGRSRRAARTGPSACPTPSSPRRSRRTGTPSRGDERLGQVRDQHAVDQEARRIVHQHRRLADPHAPARRRSRAPRSSLCAAADDFDQRHLRDRVEKVQPDDALAECSVPAAISAMLSELVLLASTHVGPGESGRAWRRRRA